ncbi:hypothetical protein MLD38_039679 [Melastoma candidum]|uniref:Uncharacterized protein n=1 Tax=Melastoma candidum TaxID=119954 RepID=A0ACB9L3K1_9MYRT|nr:hypothetical protein MLD38_039679 [Melastoma candidum]
MTTLSPIPFTKRLLPDPGAGGLPVMNSLPSSIAVLFLLMLLGTGLGQTTTEVNVGVVLDMDTLVGKVGWTSISLSLSDFYASHPSYLTRLKLNLRDSRSDDVAGAAAGSHPPSILSPATFS